MKTNLNKLSLSFLILVALILGIYSCQKQQKVIDESTQNLSSNQIHLSNNSYSGSDTIIRFYGDSVGIGYIVNGQLLIDNLDTSNYLYTENAITYNMSNFRIEESMGHYDFLMFGTGPNNQHILVSFPCFIDVPNYTDPFAPAGGTVNSCKGVCCSSCTFTRDNRGIIDGCSCGRSGTGCGQGISPHCDHSVSTSFGKENYQSYIMNYNQYPPYDTY